jgi:hypothetical protein
MVLCPACETYIEDLANHINATEAVAYATIGKRDCEPGMFAGARSGCVAGCHTYSSTVYYYTENLMSSGGRCCKGGKKVKTTKAMVNHMQKVHQVCGCKSHVWGTKSDV